MKTLLILSLTLSFASATFAQVDTSNANQTVNGLLEGKWIQHFDYEKGVEVGSQEKSAPFYRVTMYKAGKHTGTVKEYYRTGELWYEAFYNSDWTKIVRKDYYMNAKMILRDSAMDDKGNEKIETFYDNGKVDAKFVITLNVLGDCTLELQDPDGDLGLKLIGVISGEVQKYDGTSGNIQNTWLNTYDKTKGEYFSFTGDDKLWSLKVTNIKTMLKKDYSDKGILMTETPYTDGIIHGVVKEYYETGILKSEKTYAHKKLNGPTKMYDKNGKLVSETPWLDGRITGVVKQYYPNGVVQSETFYSENNPVSDPTLYDVDGHKITK